MKTEKESWEPDVRSRLERRLAEIEGMMVRIDEEDRANTSSGELDVAQEWEDAEVREGEADALRSERSDIDDALERIDRGEYGVCAVCGSRIAPERLALLPATAVCAACARD